MLGGHTRDQGLPLRLQLGPALVKERLERRKRIRAAAYRELPCDEEAEALARRIEVPWTLISLRQEWNKAKGDVVPWWGEKLQGGLQLGPRRPGPGS